MEPMSASLPGFWSWSQTRGPAASCKLCEVHFICCWSPPPRHGNTKAIALPKQLAPLWCQAPPLPPCLTARGCQADGRWKRSRRQPSGAVGTLRWLQGEQQHAVVPPTQTPALPDLPEANVILPNPLALVTRSVPAPSPVPPEVRALLGGIDEDAELGADIQPAASDGHSGSSSLRAVQGGYGLHHRKLKTKGKSVF